MRYIATVWTAPASLHVKCSWAGRARPGQLLCAMAKESGVCWRIVWNAEWHTRARTHGHTKTRARLAQQCSASAHVLALAAGRALCVYVYFLLRLFVWQCTLEKCSDAVHHVLGLFCLFVCFHFRVGVGFEFIINAFIYLHDPRSMQTAEHGRNIHPLSEFPISSQMTARASVLACLPRGLRSRRKEHRMLCMFMLHAKCLRASIIKWFSILALEFHFDVSHCGRTAFLACISNRSRACA